MVPLPPSGHAHAHLPCHPLGPVPVGCLPHPQFPMRFPPPVPTLIGWCLVVGAHTLTGFFPYIHSTHPTHTAPGFTHGLHCPTLEPFPTGPLCLPLGGMPTPCPPIDSPFPVPTQWAGEHPHSGPRPRCLLPHHYIVAADTLLVYTHAPHCTTRTTPHTPCAYYHCRHCNTCRCRLPTAPRATCPFCSTRSRCCYRSLQRLPLLHYHPPARLA